MQDAGSAREDATFQKEDMDSAERELTAREPSTRTSTVLYP